MRVYVVASGVVLAPFGEPVAALPVGNEPLGALQDRLLRARGLEVRRVASLEDVPRDEDRLVTFDHVYFTRRVLKSLLARWHAAGRPPSRLALPAASTFVRRFSSLRELPREGEHALFDLWALPRGAGLDGPVSPLPVVYREHVLRLPIPAHITGHAEWEHPVTTSVCLSITHWYHLLEANRLAVQVRWVDEVVGHPLRAAAILARGLLPGRGRWWWRVLGAANVIERGADVHPTARLEGCFVGAGARIGAQALVRGAIIGAGANLEDRVNVAYSVIGPRAFISKYALVYTSAVMEDGNVGGSIQMCLTGRRVGITPRATPLDVVPGGRVRVRHEGRLQEIDAPVLGACLGHDVFLGPDVYVGPGRAIPSGVRVVPDPGRVLLSVPEDLAPGTYTVRAGALAPVGRAG